MEAKTNVASPPAPRVDHVQTDTTIQLAIYIKDAKNVECQVSTDHVPHTLKVVSMQHSNEGKTVQEVLLWSASLWGNVQPNATVNCTPYKIEITLTKSKQEQWPMVEASPCTTTNSKPRTSKWSDGEFESNPDLQVPPDDQEDFMKRLYRNSDEDARRAMMKSYSTSGGTVLSNVWKDVKDAVYDPKNPTF